MNDLHSLPSIRPGDLLNAEQENRIRDTVRRHMTGGFDTPVGVAFRPGTGGSTIAVAAASFAMIVSKTGTLPPFRYVASGASMDINGAWSAAAGDFNNVFNLEEQGTGGQFVNALNAGDVVVIYPAPGGADAYVCHRAHYRGTY